MRTKYRLYKLTMMMLCGMALLASGGSSSGSDDFYVIASGSPWVRNGNNIYYTKGYVGIGRTDPVWPLDVDTAQLGGLRVRSSAFALDVRAWAIQGWSSATSGTNIGVWGITSSQNANSSGVLGNADGAAAGVRGYNGSALGYGVRGENPAGYAIWSEGNFRCNGDSLVIGHSVVSGYSNVGDYSIIGGNLYVYGTLYGYGGKSAIVATSEGNRKLYCQESPEVWFEDFGEGKLVGGMAHIDLDPLFLETVTIDEKNPLKVFIQLNDDCNGVYVQRQATGFEVKELRGGTSRAQFTYRVVAKRKGFETARLETAGDTPKFAALKETKK